MKHNDDPTDDLELHTLLREWQAPGAPPSLDARILKLRRHWWSDLLTGSIRVPIPIGIALAVALFAMAAALLRKSPEPPRPPASGSSISLAEFRPVTDLNVRVLSRHATN